MTTIKKNYVKPQMTVIGVEPQQMICTSQTYSIYKDDDDLNDIDSWYSEFE